MSEDAPRARLASARVARAAKVHPVVFVIGARQVGKSTLVESLALAEGREMLTLDDPAVRASLRDDPLAVLESGARLIIDEFQREPGVILALKRAVDRMGTRRRAGQYIVTGSANPLAMRNVDDSLAGRAAYVRLHGLTRREALGEPGAGAWEVLLTTEPGSWSTVLHGTGAARDDWRALVRAGGYPWPRLFLETQRDRADWRAGYVRNHVDRDVRDVAAISNDVQYHRLMQFAGARTGALLNQAELARDAGTSTVQVSRWLHLLEATFLITRLPAFARNSTTRLIKAPKLYWLDTGLAMHLGGRTMPTSADFENLILCDLLAWADAQERHAAVTYWRTASGQEVDFVLESGDKTLLGVEVKSGRRVSARDAKHLRVFVDTYAAEGARGVVLYDGDAVLPLHDRIAAVPWWMVL